VAILDQDQKNSDAPHDAVVATRTRLEQGTVSRRVRSRHYATPTLTTQSSIATQRTRDANHDIAYQ